MYKAWFKIRFYLAFGLMSLACSAFSQQYVVNISASAQANAIGKGPSAPISVAIYSLAAQRKFSKAKYFALADNSQRTLRNELLHKQEVILLANKPQRLVINANNAIQYLGIVASYKNLNNKQWRRVIDLKTLTSDTLQVRVLRSGLKVIQQQRVYERSPNRVYLSGFLGIGSLQGKGEYQLNAANTRGLNVKANGLGPLGFAFGYQMQFATGDNLAFFSSLSLETQLRLLTDIKAKGEDLNYLHERAEHSSFNKVEIDTSAVQYLLVLKSDLLRYQKFSVPFSFGFGLSQYKNKYTLIRKSNGAIRSTKSSNTAAIYQVGLGLDYRLDKKLALGIEYLYVNGGHIRLVEPVEGLPNVEQPKLSVQQQFVVAKLSYYF